MHLVYLVITAILLCGSPAYASTTVDIITQAELESMLGQPEVLIIDARAGFGYSTSHHTIPGAERLSPDADINTVATFSAAHPSATHVVVFCACKDEFSSLLLAERLRSRGLAALHLYVLAGGWRGWFSADYPVAPRPDTPETQALAEARP